ncbi:MAG: hypothetical protein WAN35_06800 [Terracidiphilus sp.]
MSEFFQFGHPDADLIGAFVEQALPVHEREQMLGHLALCPECRVVVALLLPPLEAPATPPAAERKPWWSAGPLAWPALAAFATLAVIVVSLHQGPIAPKTPAPNQTASAPAPTQRALAAQPTVSSQQDSSIEGRYRSTPYPAFSSSSQSVAAPPANVAPGQQPSSAFADAPQPFAQDEALKQIYSQYNAQKKTARWGCAKDQEYVFPCTKEYSTVSISVLLKSEVIENGVKKIYIAASATPNDIALQPFQCHLCRPAIGVGVFAWQSQHWVLQSANAAVGAFSGYGDPGAVELAQIGPEKHGLLLSANDLTHGHYASFKVLLIPLGQTVSDVWHIVVDQNDGVDTDLDETKATFKFFNATDSISSKYYDIEVISKGNSSQDGEHLKPENWTEIYHFADGKYKLLRHANSIKK